MSVGSVILDIAVFILSLGLLITLHELGHLTTAKIFKVYCYEFSIGMGPSLYTHKPNKEKGQETAFSVRALPIGGYVSMAGEDLADAEGVPPELIVPKDRTIEGKPRWQRLIIMAAGVAMNFLLGFILLSINYNCCTQTSYLSDSNKILVLDSSPAASAGLVTGDEVLSIQERFYYLAGASLKDDSPSVPINAGDQDEGEAVEVTCYALSSAPTDLTDYNSSISSLLSGTYYLKGDDGTVSQKTYVPKNDGDVREVVFRVKKSDGSVREYTVRTTAYSYSRNFRTHWSWGTIGIGCERETYRYSFGEGLSAAGKEWAYDAGIIFHGLGSLFNPANWSQMSGIVGIFQVSSAVTESGISSVLLFWGMMSINLAIVNLLPFPGLDGWQILLTLIECVWIGIHRLNTALKNHRLPKEERKKPAGEEGEIDFKKMKGYQKFKRIASTVGLILLMVLAVVLIVKDILNPIV